ncbi:alpha/beta-hydrolase [Lactarius deliciosus]|nr:alpha/beta-hydrolase [Lactarius deliciosus]
MSETLPLDGPSTLPPAREIPSTFMASFRSWWTVGEKGAAASEERLLRRLPFFRSASSPHSSPDSPVVAHTERVLLSKPKHYLNSLAIKSTTPSPDAPPPAVLLHGYGAGLGFFFLNFPALAQWAWHAWNERVDEAESFFVESLEEWRERTGLEKMTLIGHFSWRRVHKLVLLSPAGVPRGPDTTLPSREMLDRQVTGEDGAVAADSSRVAALEEEQLVEKKKETFGRKLFTHLWEEGWSPFQLVRSSLFWGPMLVGKYSSRRFGALNEDEMRDMHDYIMNITLAKGSGEYCISHILAPGAYARMPLVDRVSALKMPISFVYGEHDWMDPSGGVSSIDNLKAAGNEKARMYIVPRAGHHVYLDNAKAVNKLLLKELNE